MITICLTFLMLFSEVSSENATQSEFLNKFQQKGYVLTPERSEVVRYDKNYVNHLEIKTFKYNRTTTAFNVTMNYKCDLHKIEVVAQAYLFLSNEYRLFPMRMQFNLCSAIDLNIFGMATFPCGNFTGCAVPKGKTVRLCNWAPDQSKYPPLIPPGRYMSESQIMYNTTEIAMIRCYAAIAVPIPWT